MVLLIEADEVSWRARVEEVTLRSSDAPQKHGSSVPDEQD